MASIAQRLRTASYYLAEPPGSDERIRMIQRERGWYESAEGHDLHADDVHRATPDLDPPCPACGTTMAYDKRLDVWTCAPCEAAHGEAVLAGAEVLPFAGTVRLSFEERDALYTAYRQRIERQVALAEAEAMWSAWCDRLQAFVPPVPPSRRRPFAVDLPPDAREHVNRMAEVIDTTFRDGDDLAHFLITASTLVHPGQEAMFDALIRAAVARDSLSDGTYVPFNGTREETPLWWRLFKNVPGGDPREALGKADAPSSVPSYKLPVPLDIGHAWRVLDILEHQVPGCITVNAITALPKHGWAAHRAVALAWVEHRFILRLKAIVAYRQRHPRRPWRTQSAFNAMLSGVWRSTPHIERLIEAGAQPNKTRICTSILCSGPLLTTIVDEPCFNDADTAKLVAYLLDHGADVNELDSGSRTALFHAAAAGYQATAKVLIDAGVDVDHRDNLDWSAGNRAVLHSHFELFEQLVAAGLDPIPVVEQYAHDVKNDDAEQIKAYCRDYLGRVLRRVADEVMEPATPITRRRL